jgi:uncharacterized membrane protein
LTGFDAADVGSSMDALAAARALAAASALSMAESFVVDSVFCVCMVVSSSLSVVWQLVAVGILYLTTPFGVFHRKSFVDDLFCSDGL